MPSKIKNAIGTGDVNVGFSAALRNPPVPEEKLVATLEYDDIGPRANVGGYQFYRGTIPYLGRITDILQANNVRLGHTDSNNQNVEAILNKRVRGETLRWEINSNNYIDWIVSSAVRARNDEHEFNITLKENGITNITTQGNNSHQFVDFKFYAVELVPDTAPPVPGQFGVFRWQSADYVNPQGAVNPGDIELSSNNREVDHLTNDNVEDVDVIGIEYENGTDLAQFVDSLNAGSALIIYRDNQNVVKYNITASAPDQPAGANLFVRLDVSYADHHLGADGLDATGVDIPVHLGRLAGLSGSSGGGGGGNMKIVAGGAPVQLLDADWVSAYNLGLSGSPNGVLLEAVAYIEEGADFSDPVNIATRIMRDDTYIGGLGLATQPFSVKLESSETTRDLPLRFEVFDPSPGSNPSYDLDIYSVGRRNIYIMPATPPTNGGDVTLLAYDSNNWTRNSAGDITLNTNFPRRATTQTSLFGLATDGQTIWISYKSQTPGSRPVPQATKVIAFSVSGSRRTRMDVGPSDTETADLMAADTKYIYLGYSGRGGETDSNDRRVDIYDKSSLSLQRSISTPLLTDRDDAFNPPSGQFVSGIEVAYGRLWVIRVESRRLGGQNMWVDAFDPDTGDKDDDLSFLMKGGNSLGSNVNVATYTDGTYFWVANVGVPDTTWRAIHIGRQLVDPSQERTTNNAEGIASLATVPRFLAKGSFISAELVTKS